MIEEIKRQTTDEEMKMLRAYGSKITVQPHAIIFSSDVPSNIVGRIFELYDIFLEHYEDYELPIGNGKVYDARHGTFKAVSNEGILVEYVPPRPTDVDTSIIYRAFFKDINIKVKTRDFAIFPDEVKDKFDLVPVFGEPQTVAVTADTNLAYGNEYAPSIANTAFFDLFFRALTSPQYIDKGHISNANEKITVTNRDSDITITRQTKDETQSIKISNLNFRKRNIKTIQIFAYLFQKLSGTPGANTVYVEYDELTKIGMYDTIDGARRGVHNFYDFFHGTDGNGNKHIPGVSVSGTFKIKRKKTFQKERDLIIGRDVSEGGQTIFFNPYCDLRIFTAYTSFFPLWAYRLKNLDAFLLVRYIFYTARMKGNHFATPDKADQIINHTYKYFTLTLDSCRDAIGLPSPADVTGRKYKEKIREPLEKAIEDVESEIAQINAPDESILVTLTPIGTDNAKNIESYLRCTIEIGIIDTFADSFIEAAVKHEKKVAQFKDRVEKQIAKNAARKSED